MRQAVMILLSAVVLSLGIALMEIGERTLTAAAFAILALIALTIYRRFRRSGGDVSWVFHAVAAVGVTIGLLTLLGGVGHSAAVTALAFEEGEWVPVTILRFTTGAMLVYSGAVSVAVTRAIRSGRSWAVGMGTATGLPFWLYLILLLPLPGTGGAVPPMLGLWTAYLLWLVAAIVAIARRSGARRRVAQRA